MAKMKAVQIDEANGKFENVEREIPQPSKNEVLVKIEACGVCHSDAMVKEGQFPGIEYPRVPGHEVIGHIEKAGDEVKGFEAGQRVGVGWHGGHCFKCDPCRRGDFINCENLQITGISYDGGYAEYMTAPEAALVTISEDLNAAEAAPLLCAGVTTYNSLRNSPAQPGDLVAVLGIGGLGHLGIQYAAKMGFETVAISHGSEKKDLAEKLGASHFIDSSSVDPSEALQKLGGAKTILATAPNSKAISSVVGGLGPNGQLLVVGAAGDPIEVSPMQLIGNKASIQGWASGTPKDSEDTVAFSHLSGVKSMIETFTLEDAEKAYERMMNNDARFRSVLVMD